MASTPGRTARRRTVLCGPPWFASMADPEYADAALHYALTVILPALLQRQPQHQQAAVVCEAALAAAVHAGSFPALLDAIDWFHRDLTGPIYWESPDWTQVAVAAGGNPGTDTTIHALATRAAHLASVRAVLAALERAEDEARTPAEHAWITALRDAVRRRLAGYHPGRPREDTVARKLRYWQMVFRWSQAQAAFQRHLETGMLAAEACTRVWTAFDLEALVLPVTRRLGTHDKAITRLRQALQTPEPPDRIALVVCACHEGISEGRLRNIVRAARRTP
jgi:hypothetical protein